ncbi:DegV family protein [Paratissierella segnis]|uniref:DegV family protein n=1 Tax=Paratissierella segnis TaxID=2763679 RepID=A0A926IKH3_9FIRM|nr:DegV family protein [Paratissierella segnis]MBC8588285.1 DegV family protein [Paratissierella segnis]
MIKILSDTCCDLPEDIIEEYDIDILPIVVLKGEKEYLDRVTIDAIDVYNGMRNGEIYKTAQIPPSTFQKKFEEYAKNNVSCIYLAFSSGLSGTYQTSVIVLEGIKEQYPDFDMDIIDTKAASVGFGLIVLEAAKLAKEGKSKEEILKAINFYKENVEHIVYVDNIEYLYRGGRVSRTQSVVGGLLNIKPIIEMKDGKLVPFDKVRGKNNGYKKLLDTMAERGKAADFTKQIIGINHADDINGALKLKELIEERFGAKEFVINIIGATIGAHVGPGTLSIFFLRENYE